MTPSEYFYLRGMLNISRKASERAREEGEVFRHSPPYVQLSSGIYAAAWSDGSEDYLRLKYLTRDRAKFMPLVALAFHVFFEKGCAITLQESDETWTIQRGSKSCSTSS